MFVVRHVLVDVELATGERGEPPRDAGAALAGSSAVDQRRSEQRTRIDHRIRRASCSALELDGVERLSRGLDAHAVEGRAFGVQQREREQERFHRRLDAERHLRVGTPAHAAVGQRQGDRAEVGIGRRQLGDAVVDLSPAFVEKALAQVIEVVPVGIVCGGHGPSLAGSRVADGLKEACRGEARFAANDRFR